MISDNNLKFAQRDLIVRLATLLVTQAGTFDVCVPTDVALRMFIMQDFSSGQSMFANQILE